MRGAREAQVLLRHGCWHQGMCLREVRVRAIAEGDDGLVDELNAVRRPLERDTRLLQRCVAGLADAETLQQLSLGDRAILLLCARRLTFGGEIDCVLKCPQCDENMDFQLHIDQLLTPIPADAPRRYFEETVIAAGERYKVRLRVPCGADFEESLRHHGMTTSESIRVVLAHCVEWARKEADTEMHATIPLDEWPEELAQRVSDRLGEFDPQAEIALQLQCPACRHQFSSSFDCGEYFFRELSAREDCLYREVHQLALAYHWSEADILSMSSRKRQHYLDLLAETSGE
jgi:hypothetical protein